MTYIVKETADNLDLIRKILADSGFSEIKNITRLQSGSRSVAYYADDYIFRFLLLLFYKIILQVPILKLLILQTQTTFYFPHFLK